MFSLGDFVLLDGGTHQLFSARHSGYSKREILALNLSRHNAEVGVFQLRGPLCTPVDRMGEKVELATPQLGDRIGFPNTGAYGLTMSPLFFLGHPAKHL